MVHCAVRMCGEGPPGRPRTAPRRAHTTPHTPAPERAAVAPTPPLESAPPCGPPAGGGPRGCVAGPLRQERLVWKRHGDAVEQKGPSPPLGEERDPDAADQQRRGPTAPGNDCGTMEGPRLNPNATGTTATTPLRVRAGLVARFRPACVAHRQNGTLRPRKSVVVASRYGRQRNAPATNTKRQQRGPARVAGRPALGLDLMHVELPTELKHITQWRNSKKPRWLQ